MCRNNAEVVGVAAGGGGRGRGGGGGGLRGRQAALKEWLSGLKANAPKLGLFVFFVVYIAAGAKIFQVLEHPAEVRAQEEAGRSLLFQRSIFLQALVNMSAEPPADYEERVSDALRAYEDAVEGAVGGGVSPSAPREPSYQWSFVKSVFFASTVITTIGYGNVAPVTTWGRLFCILFGFVGIPVTVTVIADLGTMFANAVSAIARHLHSLAKYCGPFKRIKAPVKGSRWLMVLGSVAALLVYIAVGGALFIQWEDWNFFEAFYFCFITMTTIGLGDFVPVRTEFMLVCTLYILVGLALTSTIIELVRRQYAEGWQQFKELSGRLGDLSGPLAEQLRRLGEQAGDINIDVRLMKDLKDLRSALQLSSRLEALSRTDPKLRGDVKLSELLRAHLGGEEDGGEAETEPLQPQARKKEKNKKKKVVQVIIYESSV